MDYEIKQGDATNLPLATASVDLTFGSSPYVDARRYGRDDIARDLDDAVDMMLASTREALRVCRGLVVWVYNGVVRDGVYQPAPEMLMTEAYRSGIELYRPVIWYKNGMPGSGGKRWLRNDWEYILAFKNPGPLPWANPLAEGKPPKHDKGGRMRNRGRNDERCDRDYPTPRLANPGDVLRVTVGGGHLGHPLAHENEAPFPEGLPDFFIKCFCPPGGTVLDPFCGSGTTIAVARKLGRRGIGIDIRESQVELARQRVADPRYRPIRLPRSRPPMFEM